MQEIALPREQRLPPRWLPLLYFGFAHLCLAAAFAAVALDPRGVAGFYYHPRMVAIVHLVTLGWITSSILGAVYMIGPMALRMPMPARTADRWAFGLFVAGVSGMVIHFWIAEHSGMVWGAGMVTLAVSRVAWRVLSALPAAPIQRAVKLHFALGFLNLLLAATAGLLLALDKMFHFLPGYVLANVTAHAHLAALGWALMIVMGAGYRLLPMLLPAAMPDRSSLWASALLLETGVLGLAAGLVLRRPWAGVFAVVAVAGLVSFLREVIWMVRNPRPAPKDLRRPDLGILHVAQALGYLLLAAGLGLALVFSPPGEWKIHAALVYGVLGLVGFLAQMVIGVNARLLPLFSWLTAYAGDAFRMVPPSPHAMPNRALQVWTLGLWSAGVPLLAAGLALDRMAWLTAAGWTLLAAVLLDGAGAVLVIRRARKAAPATLAAIMMLAILPLSCRMVPGPAGFWKSYRPSLIADSDSDQGPWGGERSITWRSESRGTFSVREASAFAKRHGWKLMDQRRFDGTANSQPRGPNEPAFFPAASTVVRFDSGWIREDPGTSETSTAVGYVQIADDGTRMYVHHFWGNG